MFFTARRYANAVYAVVSVRPSVRPLQAGTVPKRLNIGSRKQRRRILLFDTNALYRMMLCPVTLSDP